MQNIILKIENIYKSYGSREILHDVSLELKKGEVLGLVGESGSGKSTCARVLTGLVRADSGRIWIADESCADSNEPESGGSLKPLGINRDRKERRRMQMVFQNPDGSLNPRYKVGQILYDAMSFHIKYLEARHDFNSKREFIRQRSRYYVERLGLPRDTLSRYPASFSGGQKQRIALARALCVEPDILIADEPTSSLDVSVQYSMLELIKEIQSAAGLSVIFISHDLGVIKYMCDTVAVMKDGRIAEHTGTEEFFRSPCTAYGRQLLETVPGYKAGRASGGPAEHL